MIGDLPDLDDFFSNNKSGGNGGEGPESDPTSFIKNDYSIGIYISKEEDKWILADFINIAVGGIGLHIMLPIQLELTAKELNNLKVKFVKKDGETEVTIKEVSALVRWQESDNLTGNLKLGIHFHGEVKTDQDLEKILKELKAEQDGKE